MADIQIIGYHTCKTEGGWSYIKSEAPFLSGSGLNQWLTQGYYFWTDSDRFAHMWGRDSYDNDYAILECKIVMNEELLLDLVGSTKAQIYFERLLTKFRLKLKDIDPTKEATVHGVIKYWRKQAERDNAIFPFVAIKVQDDFRGSTIAFTGKRERMHIVVQRQQLCLFESGLHLLKEKKTIHPEEFSKRS